MQLEIYWLTLVDFISLVLGFITLLKQIKRKYVHENGYKGLRNLFLIMNISNIVVVILFLLSDISRIVESTPFASNFILQISCIIRLIFLAKAILGIRLYKGDNFEYLTSDYWNNKFKRI